MIETLFSLAGRSALVTGGSSGLGRAMALALAGAGADVAIVGRQPAKVDAVVAELTAHGGHVRGLAVDLTAGAVAETVARVRDTIGAVDILVNAAGVNLRQPVDAITEGSWDETHAINLKVPFFLARAFVPAMRERGRGRIINVASLQASRAFPNGLAYGAAKGGLAQLTRAMAEAWSADGINANAIAPGFFRTPLTAPLYAEPNVVAALARQTAIGRNGEAADVHGVTIFLASPASDYITGQVIYVDGGWTAR